MKTVTLCSLFADRVPSLDPTKFPAEQFELWSIPSYDAGKPEELVGSAIGSSKKLIQPNDILLSRIIPHIRRAWVVRASNGARQLGSSEWIVFRSPDVDPNYLRHFFLSDPFHTKFMQTVAGVGGSLLRARPESVGEIRVPLPSMDQQRRIAAILDQADDLRRKRREVFGRLKSLRRAIFLDIFGDPTKNPRVWPEKTLEDIFHFRTGKLDANAARPFGKFPFFTCSREDFRIDVAAFDCEALLLAGNNATGDYSVKHYKGEFNAYQRTYVITLKDEKNSYEYAQFVLEQRLSELKRISKGTNTKYLTLQLLNKIVIPWPPPRLQAEFARRVSAMNDFKAANLAHLAKLDSLFASLQHRAFRGEL